MKKIKENVIDNFWRMIKQSWTYNRLTQYERNQLEITFFDNEPVIKAIKGTYQQKWAILQAVYSSFQWREKEQLLF